jgi:hypothetical protein
MTRENSHLQKLSQRTLGPRKPSIQAHCIASVEAILRAMIQVSLKVDKDNLTTTRVADRLELCGSRTIDARHKVGCFSVIQRSLNTGM